MAWTVYQSLIALLMVITGSINTISTKWADVTKSPGRPNATGEADPKSFNHPFVQSAGMFLGEISCLLAFSLILSYYRRVKNIRNDNELPEIVQSEPFNRFLFFIPALLDMTATTTMYVGLTMTSMSSFQMLRGALIVFTGFLSITILKRKLKCFQWLGIFIIIVGLAVVGSNDLLKSDEDKNGQESHSTGSMITGDVLIIVAQIMTAFQMIAEEKFLTGKRIPPLQAVGFEGLFGFLIACAVLVLLFFVKNGAGLPIEDSYDAYLQIINEPKIAVAIGGNVVSIAFFNFAGISVTKEISATTRTVLDSVRTLIVWVFGLLVGWEKYSTLQLFGFIILITGIMVHNDVLFRPFCIKKGYIFDEEDRYGVINSAAGSSDGTNPVCHDDDEDEESKN